MVRILVTGAAGYIGSHSVYFLQKQGHSIIVVDNLSRGYRNAVPKDLLYVMDIQETDKLAKLLASELTAIGFTMEL